MTYKITYESVWVHPQTFYAKDTNELHLIVSEGKDLQYKVTVEEVSEQ